LVSLDYTDFFEASLMRINRKDGTERVKYFEEEYTQITTTWKLFWENN